MYKLCSTYTYFNFKLSLESFKNQSFHRYWYSCFVRKVVSSFSEWIFTFFTESATIITSPSAKKIFRICFPFILISFLCCFMFNVVSRTNWTSNKPELIQINSNIALHMQYNLIQVNQHHLVCSFMCVYVRACACVAGARYLHFLTTAYAPSDIIHFLRLRFELWNKILIK